MAIAPNPADPTEDGSIGKVGFLAIALGALGFVALSVVGAAHSREIGAYAPPAFWIVVGLIALAAVAAAITLARLPLESPSAGWKRRVAVSVALGLTGLFLWETIVVAAGVSPAVLPAPIAILVAAWRNAGVLVAEAGHTLLTTAVPGWLVGCAMGALAAFAADRLAILRRLTLPLVAVVAGFATAGAAPAMAAMLRSGAAPWTAAAMVVFAYVLMLMSASLSARRAPSSAIAAVFAGLKLGAVVAVAAAVAAEAIGGATFGLGAQLPADLARGALDQIGAHIAATAAAAAALYALVALVEGVAFKARDGKDPR